MTRPPRIADLPCLPCLPTRCTSHLAHAPMYKVGGADHPQDHCTTATTTTRQIGKVDSRYLSTCVPDEFAGTKLLPSPPVLTSTAPHAAPHLPFSCWASTTRLASSKYPSACTFSPCSRPNGTSSLPTLVPVISTGRAPAWQHPSPVPARPVQIAGTGALGPL